MGLFFYTKKGSIISTVDLPTTEIIEPEIMAFLCVKTRILVFMIRILFLAHTFSKDNIILYKIFMSEVAC